MNEALLDQIRHDQERDLLKKLAEEETGEADPIKAQEDELRKFKELEKEKKSEIEWFRRRMSARRDNSKITGAGIKSPKNKQEPILVVIKRQDGIHRAEKLEWLATLGASEWAELGYFLSFSKSKLLMEVLEVLSEQIERLVKIQEEHKLVLTPLEEKRLNFLKHSFPKGPAQRPMKTRKKSHFAMLAEQGKIIKCSNLDLSIPTVAAQPEQTIISAPDLGIFFDDIFGHPRFFRMADLPRADISFLEAILGVPPYTDDGRLIFQMITAEMERRLSEDPSATSQADP